MEPIWSLGLMSGTSLDGVDAAWLRTDGHTIEEVGEGIMRPYPAALRDKIRRAFGQREMTESIQEIERELTLFHAQVVKEVQEARPFGLIGFHGQTLFHAPPITWQIGDGDLLAREVGVDVIYDFRKTDVAHGGQGAPLVPIFHQAVVEEERPVVIVNVGGVANMTWILKGQPLIAFDPGPGGALLDDWIFQKIGHLYDQEGQLSAQGIVDEACLARWLTHPYFVKRGPKSLDRDEFRIFIKDIEEFSPSDGAATLVELTARSIVQAMDQVPEVPHKIYITGGGRRNKHLMERLQSLASCSVEPIEALNWDGDLLEAHAFAYLAVRVKAGLPTSYPTTTGVAHPVSGGRLAPCF